MCMFFFISSCLVLFFQLRLAVASLSVKKTEDALHCFERCVPISLKDDFELAPISAGLAYCMWQLKQATTDQVKGITLWCRFCFFKNIEFRSLLDFASCT